MLEENCADGLNMEMIAERLGCTGRHLRRVFMAQYNVTPLQYMQTCRLLLAKNLLTDSSLSILDVALAAGFGSLRRFNDVFKNRYQLAPAALRKQAAQGKKHDGSITLALGYRPPYLWKEMLRFLAGRAIYGVEAIEDGVYMRTAHIADSKGKHVCGWVKVGCMPHEKVLTVTVSETLSAVLPQVLSRVRRLFDLNCDPYAVYETLKFMNDIKPGLCVLGTRIPGCFNDFEAAVRAVLGQQITIKAASALAERIAAKFGMPVQTGITGLTHTFPLPEAILALDGPIERHLGAIGVASARAKTIYELAKAFAQGKLILDHPIQPEIEINKLTAIRGIGNWTAQYIAMRVMDWPDAFLETDAGVKRALPNYTAKELLKIADAWRPWRSYATINIWNTL